MIPENQEDVVRTDDPDHIRDWIEEHDGQPAMLNEPGTDVRLGIIFEDEDSSGNLEAIPWEEFFEILDEKDMEFVYVTSDSVSLDSQKFDFRERSEANTEMEESGVFDNTLETGGDSTGEEGDNDTLP